MLFRSMKNNVLINVTEGGDGNVNQPINASGNVRIDETDGKHCFVNYGSIYQISSWGYSHIRSFIPDFPTLNTPSGVESCLSHHSFIIFLVTNTNTLLSGLYLISTVPLQKPRFYAVSRACFCRYLSEYSDNSSFACMLTFWTYLMRCTYP